MWRLTPVETKQFSEEITELAKKFPLASTTAGSPNFLKLLVKSPASANAYIRAAEALANGQLTPQQREEIALAVAEINGSDYCLATHALAGRRAGLSEREISLARKATGNEPKTEVMLRFVQAVVLQRGEVNDEDFSALRKAGFSEAEVIEILANVALNIFTNYFNILAGTGMDCPPTQPEGEAAMKKNVWEESL